jgi:nucleoside-diphosphate-sugar epimerase
MEIAITGGSGRLGKALIKRLLAQGGYEIRSLDRVDTPLADQIPGVRYLRVHLEYTDNVLEPLWGCQAVAHLAAYTGPFGQPPGEVYSNNTLASYNILWAAATLGIQKVCLASSVNALGGAGSRVGHFDYFPVDEAHPTYNEDDYALSKWVMEQQADSFARRYPWMTISSLRLHALPDDPPQLENTLNSAEEGVARTLWGWTLMSEAARACELALKAPFYGHEVFFITAQITGSNIPSRELAQHAYPQTPIRGDLSGQQSFFDCSKAARLLGWTHSEYETSR